MNSWGRVLVATIAATGLIVASPLAADDTGEEDRGDEELLEEITRETPSSRYIDPASFFRFHGYVRAGLVEVGDELGADPNRAPQILVSGISERTGKNESGFVGDAALFVGGEPFEGFSGTVEVHFVGNALDPVLTEAKVRWEVLRGEDRAARLRLIAGRYWWPFGIHNEEWFSAVNEFGLVSPAASEVVPAHYNELGIMGEGEVILGSGTGLNYALSVGNGTPSFEVGDNVEETSFDQDGDRTVTGRIGLVLNREWDVELGLSAASGGLREGIDPAFAASDVRRYPADFEAYGADVSVAWGGLETRAYYYASEEELEAAPTDALDRDGVTLEAGYTFPIDRPRFESLSLLGRYGVANEDTLAGGELEWSQYGIALKAQLSRSFHGSVAYVTQEEDEDSPELDDDALIAWLVFEF